MFIIFLELLANAMKADYTIKIQYLKTVST